jgi:hypothetical protein
MGTLGRSGVRATSDQDRAHPPSARERAAGDPFLIAADILKREAEEMGRKPAGEEGPPGA